jgi:thymidylate synthase
MNTFNSVHSALEALNNTGKSYNPRGEETKELLFVSFKVNENEIYQAYPARKLSYKYIKTEMKWYLKADKYDVSIADHASIWKGLINKDNSISSHYGSIIFNGQFEECAKTLINDINTRRALIYIGDNDNLNSDSKDKRCTAYIQFFIRENKLHMLVSMRSNDAVFGLGNDLPFFSLVHNMLYVYLRDSTYNDLIKGDYIHQANSFHVYKRHYKRLNKMLTQTINIDKNPPAIKDIEEVKWLLIKHKNYEMARNNKWSFSAWLYDLNEDDFVIKEIIYPDGSIKQEKIYRD